MTIHLTEEELLSIAGGYPEFTVSKEASAHLASCPYCSERAGEILKAFDLLNSLPVPVSPAGLAGRITADLDDVVRREPDFSETAHAATPSNEIMTPEELALFLKVPIDTVYELLADLPHLNLAGQIRFRRGSILNWLDGTERNSSRRSRPRPCDPDLSPRLWREEP